MNKKISDEFLTISPEMLDDWFNYMINYYYDEKSSTKDSFITVYQTMLGNTFIDNSLASFYSKNECKY